MPVLPIEFEYHALFVPRGGRAPRTALFVGRTSVQVRHAQPREIEPLVADTPQAQGSGMADYRVLDGRIMVPLAPVARLLGETPPCFAVDSDGRLGTKLKMSFPERPVREMLEDGSTATAAAIQQTSDSLVLWDGFLYAPADEPCLEADPRPSTERPNRRLDICRRRADHRTATRALFGLASGGEALDWLRARAQDDGKPNDWDRAGDLEWLAGMRVLRPDVLRFGRDDEIRFLVGCGVAATTPVLNGGDVERVADWYALRDWTESQAADADVAPEEAGLRMLRLYDWHGGPGARGLGYAARFGRRRLAEHLAKAGHEGVLDDPEPPYEPQRRRAFVRMGRSPASAAEPGWALRVQEGRLVARVLARPAASGEVVLPPLPGEEIDRFAAECTKALDLRLPPVRRGGIDTGRCGTAMPGWAVVHTLRAVAAQSATYANALPQDAGMARAALLTIAGSTDPDECEKALAAFESALRDLRPADLRHRRPDLRDYTMHVERSLRETQVMLAAWTRFAPGHAPAADAALPVFAP